MSYRQERGRKIARSGNILRDGNLFAVPSDTNTGFSYIVNLSDAINPICTCADYVKSRGTCAHIWAAREIQESSDERRQPVGLQGPHKRRRDWSKYNEAEVRAPEMAVDLLLALSEDLPELPSRPGRPRIAPETMFFLTGMKVYGEDTNRSAIAMSKRLVGNDRWEATCFHYNAFSNYLMREDTTEHIQWAIAQTASVFKDIEDIFIVDSSGLGTTGRARYREKRYGSEQYRSKHAEWRKLHIAIGRESKIICAALVTADSGIGSGDSPNLRPLIKRVAATGFSVASVLADKAYIGVENVKFLVELGADPVIPFKTNANPGSPVMKKLYHRFSNAFEEFHAKYRNRPIVECAFSMLKRKFSETVRSRNYTAQTNEALFIVLCHNLDVLVHASVEFGIDLKQILGQLAA